MTPVLRALPDAELFDWLRLARSENVGPRTFLSLLERFGSARAALDALPNLPARAAGRAIKIAAPGEIEAECERARRIGLRFLPLCDPAYPPSLRAIASAPPVIGLRGHPEILQRPMVAIVGSRNASAAGLLFTDRLAEGIGRAGYAVVSGLARGIDARAHAGSLATGPVGVLAGGHERIYPSEHRALVERIAETGAVISEMPLAWEPRGRDFPRRNRIVSGLAYGVVVVEAARRSGSLITARFAAEQGREVFAVPGSPFEPRAEGTNDLLRNGATFCTNAEDVIAALQPMTAAGPAFAMREMLEADVPSEIYWDEMAGDIPGVPAAGMPDGSPKMVRHHDDGESDVSPATLREILGSLISPAPVSIDDLARAADRPVRAVQALVTEMELDGEIRRLDDGRVVQPPR